MGVRLFRCAVVLAAAVSLRPAAGRAGSGGAHSRTASELMKRGLYRDAVRVLRSEIKDTPQDQRGTKVLMLAESYYMLREYARARPYFTQALAQADAGGRVIAAYRLACIACRLDEGDKALKQIDRFVADHPTDRRSGTLLLFKMKLLARRGKAAQDDIEAIHKRIYRSFRKANQATAVAADKVLTDFYLATGQQDKAKARYQRVVHGFRNVISQYERDKRPVPRAFEQAHDNAAMQLGVIYLKAERYDEAVRWLENVRYDAALKRRSRLLLAQVAYQKREFDRAIRYLTSDGFLETVPPGSLRSDMCLVLGLSEKNKDKPDLQKVVGYLSQVRPDAQGHHQAQAALGDLYRERGLVDRAIRAYETAVVSPVYEAQALFHLGMLYMSKADELSDKRRKESAYRRAADAFTQLASKYPSSRLTTQASASVEALLKKGYRVKVAQTDAELARQWEDVVRKKKGSAEAARALLNLTRLHAKMLVNEKARRVLKAPDYVECLQAADRLLDRRVYAGKGFAEAQWKDMQAEALYHRATCHLRSAGGADADSADLRGPKPRLLKTPDLQQAIRDFRSAQERADPTRLDLVKSIELALLESLFKSDKAEQREQARARFAELANEYGSDVRFQRLAMDLAEWYRRQKRYAEAAREYRGIAERGKNLPRADQLKALFLAGKLYSQAAHELRTTPGKTKYGILIYPREVIKLPGLLKSYRPLRRTIRIKWPSKSKAIPAKQAIAVVSKASGIPFVWSPQKRLHSVALYLEHRKVTVGSLHATVAGFLRQILDLKHHRLAFDIGITGGKATIEPPAGDSDDPDRGPDVRVIEIYDQRRWAERYRPMARSYGRWRDAHGGVAMLFNVIRRIEQIAGTTVDWASGVDKMEALSREYDEIPGLGRDRSCSCAQALKRFLEPLQLQYKIVPRDLAGELYDEAQACFDEIRKIEPKSDYGEKSLFLLALNFHRRRDYERMKIVLKEYLKLFDSARHELHHEACFWVGWVFEHEKRYRDACRYYGRAAEERLVIYKPPRNERPATIDELKEGLSYETLFALETPVSGALKDAPVEPKLVEFVRLHSNVSVRVDASAVGIGRPLRLAPFKDKPLLEVVCDALASVGLACRIENVRPKVAEKAYYRQAAAYHKDGLMQQALVSCRVLLRRFPHTGRKRDALKLKLEIHKGLKDYRNVLATLEQFKTELKGEVEPHKIDFEIAWIYFDLCRYDEAAAYFKKAFDAAREPGEQLRIRDGYARALFRAGKSADALKEYRALYAQETEELRRFTHGLMVWYLELATREKVQADPPAYANAFIRAYEKLTDEQRSRLSQENLARVTWVYYAWGLVDLLAGQTDQAIKKLAAAGNSPDDWLAADALFRIGMLHLQAKRYQQARDQFEYLLFSTKSAEAEVKATYALGLCHQQMGEAESAARRFDRVLKRFPDSVFAERIRARRKARGPATKKAANRQR